MQFKQILLLAMFCAISFSTYAQGSGSIRGVIKDRAGNTVPGITVKILNNNKATISGQQGEYAFINLPAGDIKLSFSGIGFKIQDKKTEVKAGEERSLNITLEDDRTELQNVTVTGRTQVQEVNRQAFNVTAVDAKQLYNTTLDLSGALDRVSGVRVRESGGVGSNFNLSLNGFAGNRVRYFIDGVPMDNFGSSFQINNIPINIAERLEVYKGVVPVWLGSDALGGAINIVTGDRFKNFIDASYSYGSFNTHRTVMNGAITAKNGLTFRFNAFQNYSDNDYKVTVEAADINTKAYAPAALLRRFHDKYHNETFIASAGVVGKSYADQLLVGITLGQNYKEFQTGVRMTTVYGSWHRRGNIVMPSLKYRKTDLIKGLDVTLNGNYNIGTERNIDTVAVEYDWYGNSRFRTENPTGGERSKSLSRYRNNNGLLTATASYKLTDRQNLALSNVYSTFGRTGTDVYSANFLAGPKQSVRKNVLGLAYSFDEKDKWSASVFGKYLHQTSPGQKAFNRYGFGATASYFLSTGLQVKASYEKAQRLPEAAELFGDMELQTGNPSLMPEQSNNANLGLSYGFNVGQDHHFLFNANGTYRYSNNYIYTRFNTNQTFLMLDNIKGVRALGGEGELRYSYKKWLSAGATATYQFLQNKQDSVLVGNIMYKSEVYNDQMPNIPYLFGNADVTVTLRDFNGKGNNLNLGYNMLYVHAFWLYWPSAGGRAASDEKRVVPMQLSHDLNAVYSFRNGRYNLGIEAKNITNTNLFDNFSLQRPGRGFYVNFRYFFNSFNI